MLSYLLEEYYDAGSTIGFSMLSGLLITYLLVGFLVIYAIFSIPLGFLFKKAGYSFWKALIPIYDLFVYHEIIGLPGSFTIGYIIFGGLTGSGILSIIGGIAIIVMNIVCASRTARAFNLSGIWAVGVYFAGPIVYLIIGLSKNITYAYSKTIPKLVPVNNVQPGMNFDPNTGQPINNTQPSMNFDPNTGQPINNVQPMSLDPNTGQPINNNVISPNQNVAPQQVEQPTQSPQVNSDLPDSIDSIIIKQ